MASKYKLCLQPANAEVASFYTFNQERKEDNAGIDLFVPEDVTFAPGERKLVSMKVRAMMVGSHGPVHYWMPPRSSISKTGLLLLNSIGVIDKSYRGELMAFLWNTTDKEVHVKKGDRLVQIVAPDMGHIVELEQLDDLGQTERGEGGFGSTGR